MFWAVELCKCTLIPGLPVAMVILVLEDGELRPFKMTGDIPDDALVRVDDMCVLRRIPARKKRLVRVTLREVFRGSSYNWPIRGIPKPFFDAVLQFTRSRLLEYEVMYHGTNLENVEPLWSTRQLRPTQAGMMGPGVYLGNVHKAFRFAMFETYYRHTIERGAVVRVLVDMRRARVKVLGKTEWERECECEQCAKDDWAVRRRLVDHKGLWRERYDVLHVRKIEMAPNKFLVWNPETIIKDAKRTVCMDWAEVDMATRGPHYDKRYQGHHVKTLPTPFAPSSFRAPSSRLDQVAIEITMQEPSEDATAAAGRTRARPESPLPDTRTPSRGRRSGTLRARASSPQRSPDRSAKRRRRTSPSPPPVPQPATHTPDEATQTPEDPA